MNPRKVVAFHKGRGSQEGIFAELKTHCQMDYVPVKTRVGNQLVSANDDYRTYSRPQKALVGRAASLAKAARDVAEAPLLGKDGGVPDALRQALKKAKKVLMAFPAA